MIHYVTFSRQRDGRIHMGTALHLFDDCPSVKGHKKAELTGAVLKLIRKCRWCFNHYSSPR